ncbi:pilus assembly PilX N-terminal domain-containing protein [Candidatus Poribacteria bacterium]|nr:pilus assembly PilX N-terminal domain-containing protein [Candidatus Poribacteria bacterium]
MYPTPSPQVVVDNNKGSTIIFALFLISILALLGGAIANTVIFESRDAYQQLYRTQAFYLAEAGLMRSWQELKNGPMDLTALLKGADGIAGTRDDGRFSFGWNVDLGNGNYSVIVTDNDDGDGDVYTDSDHMVMVTSKGSVSTAAGMTKAVRAYMRVDPPPPPPKIRGTIIANAPTKTADTLTLDGRNYGLDGVVIPDSGVFGISTTNGFQQSGVSLVGGTKDGVDYPPSLPGNPALPSNPAIEKGQNAVDYWNGQGGFPNTPDRVMGFAEGTLKEIAQSGKNGGQYVTDPSLLTYPLTGVTYVELASGEAWKNIDFGDSSGILVVHNAATNAVIKNLNTGTFRGLIIADDLIGINNMITGAIFNLTAAPSGGKAIGSGAGTVRYSKDTIAQATSSAIGPTITMASWFH